MPVAFSPMSLIFESHAAILMPRLRAKIIMFMRRAA